MYELFDFQQKVKGKSSYGGGNQGHQENTKNPSAANNERVVPPSQRGAGSMNIPLPGRETNVTEPGISGAPAQDSETAAERDVSYFHLYVHSIFKLSRCKKIVI